MAHHQPVRQEMERPGEIPDKLYFRIGEVARLCAVPAYVLRFWESEFPQLRPNKGGTGQRLFRRRDVEMALRIKQLLYDEGYTIPGARQLLKNEQRAREPQMVLAVEAAEPAGAEAGRLAEIRDELRDLLRMVSGAPGERVAAPMAGRVMRARRTDHLFERRGGDNETEENEKA